MQKLLLAGICLALASAAACGGSVVFVEDDDGNGGAGTTSSKTVGPTSSTSSTASTGFTTVGMTTAVTTTGGHLCDLTQITDDCQSCLDQAFMGGACTDALVACFDEPECEDYNVCIAKCAGSDGCCDGCVQQHASNVVALFDQIGTCAFCQACSLECFEVANGFCSR